MSVSSLKPIKANYKVLMTFYDEFSSDYSSKAQANGFLAKMLSNDLKKISLELLGPIGTLNRDFQSPEFSVVNSYKEINITIDVLKESRETMFDTV